MKKKLLKQLKIAIVISTFVFSTVLTGCAELQSLLPGAKQEATEVLSYRTLDKIKESGKINIGVLSNDAVVEKADIEGLNYGYDEYLAKRLAEDLGVDVNLVPCDPSKRLDYLNKGTVDIMLANYTVTEERSELVDFSLPFKKVSLGLLSPTDHVVSKLSRADKEAPLILVKGTRAEEYMEENFPNVELKKYNNNKEVLAALEKNKKASWLEDAITVIGYSINNDNYVVSKISIGDPEVIAPAVAKGNSSLLQWLDEEMKKLGEEKFFHKAYDETIGKVLGKDYEDALVIEADPYEAKD
ncbi:MAG: transporter substrate-binding domain-containing protein [Lachnospiraceae bacterium]|nr:transporter substrate-binding domain-containing protein [Lachnospiraceae bacterium]